MRGADSPRAVLLHGGGSRAGDAAAAAAAAALAAGCGVVRLALGGGVGDRGAASLARGLASPSCLLEELALGGQVAAAGIEALSRVLSATAEKETHMFHLLRRKEHLEGGGSGAGGVHAESIVHPPALRLLCLGGLYDGYHLHNPSLGPHCATALRGLVGGAAR